MCTKTEMVRMTPPLSLFLIFNFSFFLSPDVVSKFMENRKSFFQEIPRCLLGMSKWMCECRADLEKLLVALKGYSHNVVGNNLVSQVRDIGCRLLCTY